ncbi:DUF6497 family protein [Xinfangfangia sp. CPCC 101601]|uniref:DUF6497 family protein n=1 Tax=Pseudogemmobacter lacusdianii TaxID=3069608 RepID=A0ABU0VUJ3_9RHOB|nr:DUF6497 family protein [Xinfangfangia sp. CPCC 101601]MDQ2064930.1 DUF6497 family protein [Xinfangfangia sp. CPCC 101601]
MKIASRLALATAASLLLAAGACEEQSAPEAEVTGEAIAVPSGRAVHVLDVITDLQGPSGATARFRFVVPGLKAEEDASADMEALCTSYALPRTDGMVPPPQQIVIVFADQPVPFGEQAPDAVQFFEAFSLQDGACIWEMF